MNEKRKGVDRRAILRNAAEALVVNLSPPISSAEPAEVLMHELLVHKVELEMQNEELRRAHNSMEESRDRYLDYYEFSPVGYITLSREGLISELNLTGSALLGIERFRLLGRRFSHYVAPQDKDRWHRLFMNVMGNTEAEKHEFDLSMIRDDSAIFHAYVHCIKWQRSDLPAMLRITLIDISKLKQVAT